MRVFVDSVRIGVGGGRTYSYRLLEALAAQDTDHEYSVLVLGSAMEQFARLSSPRLQIIDESCRVPETGWQRIVWEQLAVPLIARRYDAEVLLSMGSTDVFLASSIARIPSVVVIQINQPWMVPDLMPGSRQAVKWAMALSVHTASHFLAVSETTRREVLEVFGVDPERVSVVYHGGASEEFSPHARARREILDQHQIAPPYILSVSSIFTFKNYRRLVEAYRLLRSQLAETPPLLVIGAVKHRSYYAEIMELVADQGLEEHVRFVGFIPHEDLPTIYANASAYVFPSLCETFGLTPLEAMACGTPVACSRASVMPEICGDAALYFDPTDPGDMASTIAALLTDASRRQELIDRGHTQVRRYSWNRTAAETVRALEMVAG